jgi:hypothetical protein
MGWFSRFKTPTDILASSAHYDIKRHMEHVRNLQLNYLLNTVPQVMLHTDFVLREVCDKLDVAKPIRDAMDRVLTNLYIEDEIYAFNIPTIESTEYLKRLQTVFTSKTLLENADTAIAGIFITFLAKMHPSIWLAGDTTLSVPLHELIPVSDFIALIQSEIMNATDAGQPCFPSTREKLMHNVIRANGIDPSLYDGKKPLKGPHDLDLEPEELIDKLLEGTDWPQLLSVPVPFALSQRFSHHHIVATTNSGKTNLLSGMIVKDLDDVAQRKASVIVLDSQGDLVRSIVRDARFAPGNPLHDRLVYIDATDIEYPLALNIFARSGNRAQTLLEKRTEHSDLLQLLLFLFGALKQEATGRQETLLRAVTSLIQEIPDATLTTLNEIFEPHDRKKQTLAKFQTNIAKLDPMDQEFFRVDFDGSEFGQSRAQIRARIQSLVTDAIFRTMFNATTQKLSMAAEMDAGKVIVINAYEDLLKNGTEVFGRFFIALAAQAAQARARMPEEKRMPTYFYIDECYKFIKGDTNVESIFDTGRKYKLGLIIAHQRLNQLTGALQSAASGAAIKMAHAPVAEDKNAIANQMRTTTQWVDSMPKHTFATYIAGMTQPVALKIPLSPLANAPQMTEEQFEKVRDVMRRKYAQMPTTNHSQDMPEMVPPRTREAPVEEPQANSPTGPGLTSAQKKTAAHPPTVSLPADPDVTSKRKW